VGEQGALHFDQDHTEIYATEDLYRAVPLSLGDGQITIRNNFKLGDLSSDGKVKSNDGAIALRIAVGKITPTTEQQSAGDVNGDRRINSADVALIMRMAVGLNVVPNDRARMTIQAMTGSPVTLQVGRVSGFQGHTVWVPVSVDNAAQLAGADLTLNYDPNVLAFTESTPDSRTVRLSGVTQGHNFSLDSHGDRPGVIQIALAADQHVTSGSGAIVEVQFTIKRSAPDGIVPVTLSSARLNDAYGQDFATSVLQRPINVSHGHVAIGDVVSEDHLIFLPLVIRGTR
jgi:hypothetical protein